ncbi:hypothetical protein Tco_0752598 [Tanacetum coccineum]|uniref:Uncharacterized protein n=1 Tax=Tanacetum coccineum TaxID=301880 RepID=A0ABQ4Z891_9ASTR
MVWSHSTNSSGSSFPSYSSMSTLMSFEYQLPFPSLLTELSELELSPFLHRERESSGPPVLLNLTRDQIFQELGELLEFSAMIDSHLENIYHNQLVITPPASPEHLLNDFMDPRDFLEVYDLESDVESDDTPIVSHFLASDEESDDGEFVAYFDPILPLNITRKTFNTIMVKELASRENNLVAIVRNVHVVDRNNA